MPQQPAHLGDRERRRVVAAGAHRRCPRAISLHEHAVAAWRRRSDRRCGRVCGRSSALLAISGSSAGMLTACAPTAPATSPGRSAAAARAAESCGGGRQLRRSCRTAAAAASRSCCGPVQLLVADGVVLGVGRDAPVCMPSRRIFGRMNTIRLVLSRLPLRVLNASPMSGMRPRKGTRCSPRSAAVPDQAAEHDRRRRPRSARWC